VTTLYCGASRRTGKGRGQEGGGVYPSLRVGHSKGSSPAWCVKWGDSSAAALLCDAREELARRGLDLDIKELYGIVRMQGGALTYGVACWNNIVLVVPTGSAWKGKRLGVFVDGGRTKIRTTTRRQKGMARPKKLSGGLSDDWRERSC